MIASDVMTTDVVTVGPETPVREIAQLLLERRIGGVPVVDEDGKVLGVVSEGDLMRRAENQTEPRRSWWLETFSSTRERAAEFIKSHGHLAKYVMTPDPVTVSRSDTVGDCMQLMTDRRIRHLPVVDDGELVGVISIGDVVRNVIEDQQFMIEQLESYIVG